MTRAPTPILAPTPMVHGRSEHRTGRSPFGDLAPQRIRDALDQVLASTTFRRSQRHRTFLRHVVDATLDGQQERLKELVIGLEVFDRLLVTYDPRRDPIVRVEAGRVREKLARYYADEGRRDPLEIRIPVGGYLPSIAPRQGSRPLARSLGSLAVLPLANLSSSPDNATFCAALADQLIDMLSRVEGLRVVGRMSASRAQAKNLDPKAVGKLLGVTMLLEGSVQHVGSRYRCIAQLFRTRDRACVWSQRFECDLADATDLFAFQDRISEAVMAAVSPPPIAGDGVATHKVHGAASDDAEARDLFERGRYLEQQRTIEGTEKAIQLFNRAIDRDPGFASAYSHLGACVAHLAGTRAEPTVPAFREVERYARRALELDSRDGDARGLIAAIVFRVERQWGRAEALFGETWRVAPNTVSAHNSYAHGLIFNGRYVEGMQHARIALDLDPLNVTVRANFALNCTYARDFPAAENEFLAVLEFDPDHVFAHIMLGMSYLWSGRADEAMDHFVHADRVAPAYPVTHFCQIFVHGFRGEIERGNRQLEALLETLCATKPYAQFNRAMADAYLGNRDAMYAALHRSAEAREVLFVSLPADPSFDGYRDDPQYAALIDRYGLPRLPPSPFLASR